MVSLAPGEPLEAGVRPPAARAMTRADHGTLRHRDNVQCGRTRGCIEEVIKASGGMHPLVRGITRYASRWCLALGLAFFGVGYLA